MPSLLATALELERVLVDQIDRPSRPAPAPRAPPARSGALHPLALATNEPGHALDHLANTVRASIATLRTGISQFPLSLQANLDPNDDLESPANHQARLARDRYLTQLREAASSEAALYALATRADANGRLTRKKTRARDDRWTVATPRSNGINGSAVRLLETIAAELDLVTFRDDDEGGGGGGDTAMTDPLGADSTRPVTLSVGGKVMVVDFSIVGTRIDRVKVAYVVAGQDRQSALAANRLERLFALVPAGSSAPAAASGDTGFGEEDEDVREQRCWKGVRRILEELNALDEESERTGRDAFEELGRLGQDLSAQIAR